jgi:hypothetical protein
MEHPLYCFAPLWKSETLMAVGPRPLEAGTFSMKSISPT